MDLPGLELRHRFLKALLSRASLLPIRFHDLRNTCATLVLSRNVNPKIVSEILGHASMAIILDTLSHVLPTMQQSAVRPRRGPEVGMTIREVLSAKFL